jgi:PPM family protein phosphatase
MSGLDFSALSERCIRTQNDDAYCAETSGGWSVFAVADGLAGHRYGGLASATAIESLKTAVNAGRGTAREIILAGVRNADAEIKALARRSPGHAGLATKLVACLIDGKGLCTVLDTDGRNCIVIRGSTAESAAAAAKARRVKSGPGPVAAPQPPVLPDMVSHVLGEPYRMKESDFSEFVLGDEYLMLSSDGLTNFLPEEAIAGIVRRADGNLDVACERLVQDAIAAGSDSTVTVVLARLAGK